MYGDDGEPYIIEGPTKLVFIQTDKKYIDQIDKELESKEERHKYIGNYDSTVKFHYLSKTAITDMKTERAVKSMNLCIYYHYIKHIELDHAICHERNGEKRKSRTREIPGIHGNGPKRTEENE